MNKENLVVLKSAIECKKGHTVYKANHFYRCTKLTPKIYLVYGEQFTHTEYNSLFELAHDRVLRDFKELGLIKEYNKCLKRQKGIEPISKSLFTNQADIHTYGNGRKAYKIWYFRTTRDMIYGFYPMQGTKAENQKECYQWYLDLIDGNVESLDCQDVCFGNMGVPLGYSKLRITQYYLHNSI